VYQCEYYLFIWFPFADTNSTNAAVTDTGFKNLKDIWKIVFPTASIVVVVTLGLCIYYVRRKLRRKGE